MFSLGVDGDDAVVEQHAVSRQLSQFQDRIMQEDEEPSPRGEEHTPLIAFLTTKLLRTSFTLKALSMALMSLFFLGFGGRWVFTFHSHPDMSNGFHLSMALLMLLQLAGTLGLCLFQAFVADDSKWTKGFRTGSKILSAAVTLDLLTVMLRLGEYLYLYNSLSTLWWSKFNITKSDWVIFAAANLLDSIALISYGWALFYIECYHDEGTSEEVAWTMLALFSLAGLSMLIMMFTGYGAVFMLLFTAGAYAVSCYWSFMFEPLLLKWAPQLHSRDINTDIMPTDSKPQQQSQYQPAAEFAPEQQQQPHFINTQSFSSMPGAVQATADIPTQYDYAQLQQQVSQGIEMGVVNPSYQ
ncbi:hypothetical protein, conserved [Eimeria tenella]|uniref:Multi-pass transmembrane protein n=1 Tax=Eimeria tenella TaxID=5802 RepID=U6L8K7_EIMTE|nr:hypothetical protein, conserved [Eimeria tenella]CDJ45528.1 hypothetical protein, conserved [Eimeria tenella]|eukprot:XP_013236274.1 hypothetical protein, conserved [Eimeria tenella]